MEHFARSMVAHQADRRRRHQAGLRLPPKRRLPAAFAQAPFAAVTVPQPKKAADAKNRLDAVPVFVVSNPGNECVVISPDEGDGPSTCLLFMEEDAAHKYLEACAENGLNTNEYRVSAMAMSSAFDFVKADDVNFRFVPSMAEVRAAGQLYKEAGMKIKHLRGVPVFQAEGLYISQDGEKLAPIFFSRRDLDVALHAAHSTQQNAQVAACVKKADEAQLRYENAVKEYAVAEGDKAKAAARERVQSAQAEEEKFQAKAKHLTNATLPKVEVSCLEDVMRSMQQDKSGEWNSAFFVPPGGMSDK